MTAVEILPMSDADLRLITGIDPDEEIPCETADLNWGCALSPVGPQPARWWVIGKRPMPCGCEARVRACCDACKEYVLSDDKGVICKNCWTSLDVPLRALIARIEPIKP